MRLLLVGTVIMGIIMLWRYLRKTRRRKKRTTPFAIPSGVTIGPTRLLEEEEIALYSLLQMAVQERYLVFSQVPLWSFVEVEAEATVRSDLLREIALKRVDFVLVHPGSCRVEHVVQIERESSPPHQGERQQRHRVGAERSGDQADNVAAKEKPHAARSDHSIGDHCRGVTSRINRTGGFLRRLICRVFGGCRSLDGLASEFCFRAIRVLAHHPVKHQSCRLMIP